MDAGSGSHPSGNGSSVPKADSPKSDTPAGSDGHPPELLVVVDPLNPIMDPPGGGAAADTPVSAAPTDVPRDEKGRVKKGHSLNPKGRTPGIPNRNAELHRLVTSRELSWCWKRAKEMARKGDTSFLRYLLDKVVLDQSPATAGIVINASASASAHASVETTTTNLHDRLAEFGADPKVADDVADLALRLAARGRHSVRPGGNGN